MASLGASSHMNPCPEISYWKGILSTEDLEILGARPGHWVSEEEVVPYLIRKVQFWKHKYSRNSWWLYTYQQALESCRKMGIEPEQLGMTEEEVLRDLPWWKEIKRWKWF